MTDLQKRSKPIIVLTGILLSIFLYLLIALVRSKLLGQSGATALLSASAFFYSRLILWAYLLAIYVFVIKAEKQEFLLWKEKKYSALFYIVSIVLILLSLFILAGILNKIEAYYGLNNSGKLRSMLRLLWNHKVLLLFTTLSAGIIEELLFRGYLIPRLEIFLKKAWLSVIISSLLFGCAHYSYGNWSQIINAVLIGLIFGFHYQKYRNIKILIICHFLIDFISILTTH